jgi:hypothetical protein
VPAEVGSRNIKEVLDEPLKADSTALSSFK